MGDVNFLANEKKNEEDKGVEPKKTDVRWTEIEKKNGAQPQEKKNDVNSADISSWLKSLKDEKPEEGKGIKELKKSKEALAEYQKVFQKTQKMAEMKEGMKEDVEKGEMNIKSRGGIAEIIKNKLSFGLGKPKEETTLKTNLIKSEGVTYFDGREKAKVFVINILLTFVIIGIAYGYLEYRERAIKTKTEALLESIESAKKDIEGLEKEAKEIDKFQRKVKIVNDLLGKHIYWTNFFTFLEDNLLSDVYLDNNFEGSSIGYFDLYSKGKNFTNITNQGRIFRQNEKVKKIEISSGELKEGDEGKEVNFVLKLEVDPSIFYK